MDRPQNPTHEQSRRSAKPSYYVKIKTQGKHICWLGSRGEMCQLLIPQTQTPCFRMISQNIPCWHCVNKQLT